MCATFSIADDLENAATAHDETGGKLRRPFV
jgi:hypothetical protein